MKNATLLLLMSITSLLVSAQTTVTFYTTMGNFGVEIYDNKVPITGGNFLTLVGQKFYDGIIFHRVIDGFMIQGGDPTGTGSGGPGYAITDEFDTSLSNLQKTISMANSGPNTGGSQFFINLVDNIFLDFDKAPLTSKHPVFGMVIANFNVVQDIGKVSVNGSSRPLVDVVMDSIRVGSNWFTGISHAESKNIDAKVYPNPIDPSSILQIESKENELSYIKIYNALGELISSTSFSLKSGVNKLSINQLTNSKLTAGLYHMNILFGKQNLQLSFISR